MQDKIYLGNLNAQRDWGHAKDYIEAMYLILQQDVAEDYVIATGKTTSIRDFVKLAFLELGITIAFKGSDENEIGYIEAIDFNKIKELEIDKDFSLKIGDELIAVDPRYFRPTEVELLIGDATKSQTKLGWIPKYDLQALVTDMMESDLKLMKKERFLKQAGHHTFNNFE
jgi:GDPmannose 4,6-dehydratase